MFTSKPNKIRQRTVAVPIKKSPAPPADTTHSSSTPQVKSASRGASSNGLSNGARKPASAPPAGRYQLTPTVKERTSSPSLSRPERKTLSVSHQRKRKVTPSTPQWASSSEDDSDAEEAGQLSAGGRKRQKTSSSIEPMSRAITLNPDLKRRIRYRVPKEGESGASSDKKIGQEARLIHGLEMSQGKYAKNFKPAFPASKRNFVVELQYPSRSRPEKFETVIPKDGSDEFNPLDDMFYTMDEVIRNYFPSELIEKLTDDSHGTVRLLKRAVTKDSISDFQDALTEYNKLIQSKLSEKVIQGIIDDMHAIPLSLTKRILAQVYQRTVSPEAHTLRKVKGRETTYGELMPNFSHRLFDQTGLNSESVFIDLGSGVGNVVLQSALQTGAESWGIEIMDNPAKCAREQASELRARARLWNISLGPINLLQGDFLESPEVDEVLRRADVVLVNNKVFPQKLNVQLLNKFLDLKEGCKVISLESFGGGAKQGARNEQSIANLFDEERYDSGSTCVSWTDESVEYFIATKAR